MQIIERSKTGDKEAFATLFEQYKNLVYKTAYLMLSDASDAEDALIEVFVRVHHSLSSYDPNRGAFTTWLHRVTINYCLNHRRRRQLPNIPLEQAPQEPAGGSLTNEVEDREAISQALRTLSEKQRAVVILRYYWDLPYAEIAQVLDIPLGTVKSRLDLALRTLRNSLKEPEGKAPWGRSSKQEVSPWQ